MNCAGCGHTNRSSARFCAQCRAKLPRVCPDCRTEVAPEDRFCDACGADLAATMPSTSRLEPPSLEEEFATFQQAMPASFREQLRTQTEGELRVVTVLFADMSRSVQTTAGLPPDEAADLVSQLLKLMVDVLLQHEGRVDRFLGGTAA